MVGHSKCKDSKSMLEVFPQLPEFASELLHQPAILRLNIPIYLHFKWEALLLIVYNAVAHLGNIWKNAVAHLHAHSKIFTIVRTLEIIQGWVKHLVPHIMIDQSDHILRVFVLLIDVYYISITSFLPPIFPLFFRSSSE